MNTSKPLPLVCIVLIASLLLAAPAHSHMLPVNEGLEALDAGDYPEAFRQFRIAAEDDWADGQYFLGLFYLGFWPGVDPDDEKAFMWLQKASEQGKAMAQLELGRLYYKGRGVPQNYQMAAKWWAEASKDNEEESMFNLATLYTRGMGVDKDLTKGTQLFSGAADLGFAKAQYILGLAYILGDKGPLKVERNPKKGIEWLHKAAEQDEAEAQYFLGEAYYYGRDVKQNPDTAIEWYTKAAKQGHAKAQFKLGKIYYLGMGAWKDLVQSYFWLEQAAAQDHEEAVELFERVERAMTPSQLQKAKQQTTERK